MQRKLTGNTNWLAALAATYSGIGVLLSIPTLISGFCFALFGPLPFWAGQITIYTTVLNCMLRIVMWPYTVAQIALGELTIASFFLYHWV